MLLIKEDDQWWNIDKVRILKDYIGVCDSCGTPLEYSDQFEALLLEEQYNMDILVPLTRFHCPACLHPIQLIHLWNSLNVSSEFEMLHNDTVSNGDK